VLRKPISWIVLGNAPRDSIGQCLFNQFIPVWSFGHLLRQSRVMDVIVVIAASAGGLEPLRRIIAALPAPCLGSIFVVMHIGNHPSALPFLLSHDDGPPASFAQDGTPIEIGHIYVAPPNHHMLLEPVRIRLNQGPQVHYTRPAADPLFVSAAEACGERVIGIVLSGGGSDGATGLQAIKEHGGTALVQHPEDAAVPFMPRAAIAAVHPDACRPVQEIAQLVRSFCSR
jgi:two-component system, chemotaxis family, protein-glutamate methylesterase/glutaminase